MYNVNAPKGYMFSKKMPFQQFKSLFFQIEFKI